jgi:hypothetical protein
VGPGSLFGLGHSSLGTPAAAPKSAGDDQRGAEKDRVPVGLQPGDDPLRSQVPLERSGGGVLLVTVEIKGTLTVDAMVDSGAASVMVPAKCLLA